MQISFFQLVTIVGYVTIVLSNQKQNINQERMSVLYMKNKNMDNTNESVTC